MKLKSPYNKNWQKKFAWTSKYVNEQSERVWLEYYWSRYHSTQYGGWWEQVSVEKKVEMDCAQAEYIEEQRKKKNGKRKNS